jgi:hypothetical protein
MMKKIAAVSFYTSLALCFAVSAFAIHIETPAETSTVIAKGGMVTLDGSIRHRGRLTSTSVQKDATNQAAYYDTRVRLGTSVKTGSQVSGRVHLETGSGSNPQASNTYTWGYADAGNIHMGGEKKSQLNILEAWVAYEPGNWGLKVGHMPLGLGEKLFFDHTKFGDDAIVAFINPNDATHLAALTIKFVEGDVTSYGDDLNGYVLLGTYKAGAMNFGADWTYLIQGKTGPALTAGMAMSNIGLRGALAAGNFNIKGDLEFQTGEFSTDVDAEGWAGMIDASTKLGGAWTLGAGLYYGSGEKYNEANAATKRKEFINFLGGLRYQSTMNGFILYSPATGAHNRGIQNQTHVQLYGVTRTQLLGKDLDLKARLNWMQLNEAQFANQKDDIGTEIEFFANWKLAQGLVYGIETAYLFTGDAWVGTTGPASDDTLITDTENVFFLRHKLELSW